MNDITYDYNVTDPIPKQLEPWWWEDVHPAKYEEGQYERGQRDHEADLAQMAEEYAPSFNSTF